MFFNADMEDMTKLALLLRIFTTILLINKVLSSPLCTYSSYCSLPGSFDDKKTAMKKKIKPTTVVSQPPKMKRGEIFDILI